MNIIVYALSAYAITAVIAYAVTAVVVLLNRVMNGANGASE